MKRFFKKASLLLVVLCLVVGSVLPSFAAIRSVSGVLNFLDNPLLWDGTSCLSYAYYTGTYNTDTGLGNNVVMRAECRGGAVDDFKTNQTTRFYSAGSDYSDYTRLTSETLGTRYLEKVYNLPYATIFATATCMVEQEVEYEWDKLYKGMWTNSSEGWIDLIN